MNDRKINRLCVYCGSSPGTQPEFSDTAREMGRLLADRNIHLIYGGASVGLMGIVADEVLQNGGQVTGIMPEFLAKAEVVHRDLTELHVVGSMHERKKRMFDLSDGFAALPGGLGTLEEMFEMLTWAQLALHTKPCGFINVNNYYDPLMEFVDNGIANGFIKEKHRHLLRFAKTPTDLLEKFEDV